MIEWLANKLKCEKRDVWSAIGIIALEIFILIFGDGIMAYPIAVFVAIELLDGLLKGK